MTTIDDCLIDGPDDFIEEEGCDLDFEDSKRYGYKCELKARHIVAECPTLRDDMRALEPLRIECKTQAYNEKYAASGRFFIEMWREGEPSGLQVTTAYWWALEFEPDQFTVQTVEKVWQVIEEHRRYYRERGEEDAPLYRGGDRQATQGYVIPMFAFMPRVKKGAPNESF